MKVIALQGDTLDLLCWRHYGRTQGVVEQALQANPTIADAGVFLAMGQCVELPDIVQTAQQDMIQLWD